MVQKGRNSGLSLVELLVSVAILSIVGIAIFSFMTTSTKLYSKEMSQADLQHEAQLTVNQIQDMLIDAAKGITYKVTAGDSEQEVLSDTGISEASVTEKNIYIESIDPAGKSVRYQITWNKADEKLYYTKYEKSETKSAGGWEVVSGANRVLMSEFVKEFSADLTNLEESRSIQFSFLFAANNVSYETKNNITLRNKVVTGVDSDGELTDEDAYQDSITISPTSVTLWPGEEVYFTHQIRSNNGGYPSQEAVYSMKDNTSNNTKLGNNGVFRAGTDEMAKDIQVIVTAKDGPKDTSAEKPSANATVRIKRVTGLGVTLTEGGSYSGKADQLLLAGSTLQLKVNSIEGNYVYFPQDLETGTISWKMEKGAAYASVNANGLLTFAKDAPEKAVAQARAIFTKGGQELAYGLSNEYMVEAEKPLVDDDIIYVDDGGKDYIAPDGELWFEENQNISVNWDKIPDKYKKKNEKQLEKNYSFEWYISLNGQHTTSTGDLYINKPEGNTSNTWLTLGIRKWIPEGKVTITLIINETLEGMSAKEVWRSNTIELKVPRRYYLYSYTKTGEYFEELPVFVTTEMGRPKPNSTPKPYVYFKVYGFAGSTATPKKDEEDWVTYNSGNYLVTEMTNFSGGATDKPISVDGTAWKINFSQARVAKGLSTINHRSGAVHDVTKVIVYFGAPNVQGDSSNADSRLKYYVPLPRDDAFKRLVIGKTSGLIGNCEYKIERDGGLNYYKLTIVDNTSKKEQKYIRYATSDSLSWFAIGNE